MNVKTIVSIAPTIINLLKMKGFDIDVEFTQVMEFIPKWISEQQTKIKEENPDLEISLMVTFYDNEVYFIPVGLEEVEGNITVTKQFKRINVSKFLNDIKITKAIDILRQDPETPILEAIEKSRIK